MSVASNRGPQIHAAVFVTRPRGALTPSEVSEIRRLRRLGRGWQTIANIIGRCHEDVMAVEPMNGAAQAVGAPVPRPFQWNDEDLQRSAQMIARGTSAETLASTFGCSMREAGRRLRQVKRTDAA
nr:hypothetical protein [Brevundimonas diminuta]